MVIDDEAHVMNLAVRDDARGHGIGRSLLRMLLDRATEMGARRATLEVARATSARSRCTSPRGCTRSGVRPGYYADTCEDAVIMWGDLVASGDRPSASRIRLRTPGSEVILAIETSCDETAAAVMRGGRELLSSVVASQVDFHARFGGVVPEIASRKHTEAIVGVVDEALEQAGIGLADDRRARRHARPRACGRAGRRARLREGPRVRDRPAARRREPPRGPHLRRRARRPRRRAAARGAGRLGRPHLARPHARVGRVPRRSARRSTTPRARPSTRSPRCSGLGYPGGPVISTLAEEGDPAAIDFPRAMLHSGDYRVLAVRAQDGGHQPHPARAGGRPRDRRARPRRLVPAGGHRRAGRQGACARSRRPACDRFVIAGGVAANPALREALTEAMEARGVATSPCRRSRCAPTTRP